MNHAEMNALGASFRQRRNHNRVERERVERSHNLRTLALGLLGGIVAVGVLLLALG